MITILKRKAFARSRTAAKRKARLQIKVCQDTYAYIYIWSKDTLNSIDFNQIDAVV